jgi:hypothetical protein
LIDVLYEEAVNAINIPTGATWEIASEQLPPGLFLVPSLYDANIAVISGIPTTAGLSTFEIAIQNEGVQITSRVLSIWISDIGIISTSLPDGVVGESYGYTVQGRNVPINAKWNAWNLPSGLTVDQSTGFISGNPNARGSVAVDVEFWCNDTFLSGFRTLPIIIRERLVAPFITLDENVISWTTVSGAVGYRIYVDGVFEHELGTVISFDLSELGLGIGTHIITLVSTNNDPLFLNSNTSNETSFVSLLNNDATLSALGVISYVLDPVFAPTTFTYTVNVPNTTANVTVSATANHPQANVTAGLGAHTLAVGTNTITVTVTAEVGTIQDYVITVNRAGVGLSNDATLSALGVTGYMLDSIFNPSIFTYLVNVPNTTASITATANHAQENVTAGLGVHTLVVGANTITVTVTAEDGTTQNYVITVNRAGVGLSNDATLSALGVTGYALDPIFNPLTFAYMVNVPNTTTSVTVTATANHAQANVTAGLGAYSLSVGANTITVTVTAEDGTTQNYVITVNRAGVGLSNDATLSALSVNSYTLSPAFNPAILIYSVNVPNTTSNISIAATANHPQANVSAGLGAHSLSVGANTITVTVIAEYGTTQNYEITVNRAGIALSNDASLSALNVTGYIYCFISPSWNT